MTVVPPRPANQPRRRYWGMIVMISIFSFFTGIWLSLYLGITTGDVYNWQTIENVWIGIVAFILLFALVFWLTTRRKNKPAKKLRRSTHQEPQP